MSKLKPRKQVSAVLATCLLGAAMFGICTTRLNAATADVDQLFQEAKTQAALLARDADTMESFTYSGVTWELHANQIDMIKSHINKLGVMISQLEAAQGDVGKRHQETIDRILPPLRELAANTTAVIDYLNQYEGRLQNPAYQDYLKQNLELSDNLYQVVSDTVAYDRTKDQIANLHQKLARLSASN
jgi:ABC-type transporter Mla subunit MlaD